MTADPAVRSIRVAVALVDRFAELARGPKTTTTAMEEMALRIGESQQLYPEIWRHLGDARDALARRGANVGDFDRLRAAESPAQLGVTGVDVHQELRGYGRSLHYHQEKTAHFNLAGLTRSREACDALMAAMPDVDWTAIARTEAAELKAAGSLTSGRWITLGIWGSIGLVALYVLVHWLRAR